MIYLTVASRHTTAVLATGEMGALLQPGSNPWRPEFRVWAADNGCFSPTRTFRMDLWRNWLQRQLAGQATCLFAVAPDVVGDHQATMVRAMPLLPELRAEGWRAAFVVQEGATPGNVPWDEFDCLFVGGKEEAWKLGTTAVALVREARERGKWTHLGRVNSWRRLDWGRYHQVDSADGTIVAVAPDRRLPEVRRWVRRLASEQPLFVSP